MYSGLVILAIVSTLGYTSALKCYQCDKCDEPFSSSKARTVECVGHNMECATVTAQLGGDKKYYRDCQEKSAEVECGIVKRLRPGFDTLTFFTCMRCNGDYCNSGTNMIAPIFLIVSALVLKYFF